MHTLSTHPADPWAPDPPAVRDTGTGFDPASGPDRGTPATSTADLEGRLTAILATVTGRPVGPEDDFFTDLGADSMLMARFCALIWYLRALGARIGPGVLLLTRNVPVATDLFTVGGDTVVRKDVLLTGYRVVAGMVETGPVTLGRNVVVGEGSVLDIGAEMGDGSQLGHRSSVQTGQVIPPGQRWHGSPAQLTDVDYLRVPPMPVSLARRFWYPVTQLALRIGVVAPAAIAVVLWAATVPGIAELQSPAHRLDDPAMYLQTAGLAAALLVGGMALAFLVASTVPRLLALLIRPGRTYPLYGLHYALHRWITRLTTVPAVLSLVGDSSYVVGYLRALGYGLTPVHQTGTNFGAVVRHETPFHVRVGSGTVVADGLSLANAEYSSSSFRVDPVTVGAHNYLGNHVIYPSAGRTGDNCLLATKVMVPIDGSVRSGVGLLGSPSFEIPRTVDRDADLDSGVPLTTQRLAAKNRHNLGSIALLLLVRWAAAFLTTLALVAGAELAHLTGPASLAAAVGVSLVGTLAITVTVERAVLGFRPQSPQSCSIYDPRFWAHERYWKVAAPGRAEVLLNGTPFKAWYWRALGVKVGRRLYDDGVNMPERTLVSLGSHVSLNVGSVIQCHSQEDGGFKSDHTTVGSGATVGTGSLVHYGVSVGAGAIVATESFLMKGESVPPGSLWGGNPARQVRPAHGPAAAAAGALSIQ